MVRDYSLEDRVKELIYGRRDKYSNSIKGLCSGLISYLGREKKPEKEINSISLIGNFYENNNKNNLEYIIKEPILSNNLEEYEGIEYIRNFEKYREDKFIKNEYDISRIIIPLLNKGYSVKNIELNRPAKKEEEKAVEKPAVPVEVGQVAGIPDEYKHLLTDLRKEHPGLRYVGRVCLENQSQHNVDFLEFEYFENGEWRKLLVVAKDSDRKEAIIPQFLEDVGVSAHVIYTDNSVKLAMQYVGERDLRDVMRAGSECDVREFCSVTLDKLAKIHVLASAHLPELSEEYELDLEAVNYTAEFKRRFIDPISGSLIMTPEASRLMLAYSSFARTFDPSSFIHGDFHSGNCRISDKELNVIDWEWAKIGEEFDDVARFVNSVLRDRADLDSAEFSREMLSFYVEPHNQYAEENDCPIMLPGYGLSSAFRYSLINEQVDKCGGAVIFAEEHQLVKDEQMEKSKAYFERSISMLEGAMELADAYRNYNQWNTLSNLKDAMVEFVATSHVQILRETAEKHKQQKIQYREPIVLVPAA